MKSMKVGTAKRFLRFIRIEEMNEKDNIDEYLYSLVMSDSKALDSILKEEGIDKNEISIAAVIKWLSDKIVEVVTTLQSVSEGLEKSDTAGVSNVRNTHLDILRSLILGWCERFHKMPPEVEDLDFAVFCECSHDVFAVDQKQKYIKENSTTISREGMARVPVYE